MSAVSNTLVQVIEYTKSGLGLLENSNPFIANVNKKYKDFQKQYPMNKGATISWDAPPRMIAQDSLIVTFTGVQQRQFSMTVDQEAAVPFAFTAQEQIFNVDDYMNVFGKSAIATLASKVGRNLALNAINHTYRAVDFTQGGVTNISQYASMLEKLRNVGASMDGEAKIYIPDIGVSQVVSSMLNQFVTGENEKLRNSWDLGSLRVSNARFYQSNLLPIHTAGDAGQNQRTLTFVSINGDGTAITFSGAGTSVTDSLKEGDIITIDATSGQGLYFLQAIGGGVSQQKVQVRVTADADSNGSGNVVAQVYPALIDIENNPTDVNANINIPLTTSMTATVANSHRAGFAYTDNPFYMGMPKLPDEDPYKTASVMHEKTGTSLRMYTGSVFAQNQRGSVYDCIWGSTLIDEYAIRLMFPV
jgi:hypothetical protein